MRSLLPGIIAVLVLTACNDGSKKSNQDVVVVHEKTAPVSVQACWSGVIGDHIPVLLYFDFQDSVFAGHIVYLNTQKREPIRLIGTYDEDKKIRLLEMDASGNISGILYGSAVKNEFTGSWFSPKTRKELPFRTTPKDTVISSEAITADPSDIYGSYHYQYGEDGYQGDFTLKKLPDGKAIFGIGAVTEAPAYNVADIPDDTIHITGTQFTYKIADAADCDFTVKFYKGFAMVKYVKGPCDFYFGHNASVEGIFVKTK